MIRRVKLDGNNWCGPTALASIGGITYDEADRIYRRIRKSKRRTVHTNAKNTQRALHILGRRRGVTRWPIKIVLDTNDGSPMTKEIRPQFHDTKELNQICRMYKGFVPVAIICGKSHVKSRHIVAYDHRRKRLCDNFSHGKVVALKDHPLKNYYVFMILMVPEEYYGRD